MPSPLPENSIDLVSHMGDDLMVVNAARVSMGKRHDQFVQPDDAKLIQYLAKNRHWTPFGQPQVQFRVRVPVFVARQWNRSEVGTIRTSQETSPALPECEKGVYNETSRRYVDTDPEFYRISEFRYRPSESVKQGSGGVMPLEPNDACIITQLNVQSYCRAAYEDLIARGAAPEQARSVLPMSMMTEWIETGSLAYWARFCGLRLGAHAQAEIRDYAKVISMHMHDLFPVSWPALMEGTP